MQARLEFRTAAPDAYQTMLAREKSIRESSRVGHSLLELVKMRASQTNGWCIDMHTKDARAAGETEPRRYALNAWHETPFFSSRERAALARAEAITLVSVDHVPEVAYAARVAKGARS